MQVQPAEFLRWLSGLLSPLCFHGTRRFSLRLFIRHFVFAAVFWMEPVWSHSENPFGGVYFLCAVPLPFTGNIQLGTAQPDSRVGVYILHSSRTASYVCLSQRLLCHAVGALFKCYLLSFFSRGISRRLNPGVRVDIHSQVQYSYSTASSWNLIRSAESPHGERVIEDIPTCYDCWSECFTSSSQSVTASGDYAEIPGKHKDSSQR